jgi:hypothetical protein
MTDHHITLPTHANIDMEIQTVYIDFWGDNTLRFHMTPQIAYELALSLLAASIVGEKLFQRKSK